MLLSIHMKISMCTDESAAARFRSPSLQIINPASWVRVHTLCLSGQYPRTPSITNFQFVSYAPAALFRWLFEKQNRRKIIFQFYSLSLVLPPLYGISPKGDDHIPYSEVSGGQHKNGEFDFAGAALRIRNRKNLKIARWSPQRKVWFIP